MDELKKRAEAFNKMLNIKYHIIVGRKGKLGKINISFEMAHFHHLIGFKYLTDRPQLKKGREAVFKQIIDGKLTYANISSSFFFVDIEQRFLDFIHFELFFDRVELFSKFNQKVNPASKMKAKYILESEINNSTFYVCIDSEQGSEDYFCRSFFPKSGMNYTLGHTKHSLLRKEKIDLANKSKIVLFDKIPVMQS